jgi:biopolymer transport protein TolQ
LNVATDLSFVTLIAQASVVVQGILLLLAAASLWSWWQIFLKLFQLKRTSRDTDAFENEFWKGGDSERAVPELQQVAARAAGSSTSSPRAFREYAKHRSRAARPA